MESIIKELLSHRDLRAIGNKEELLSDNGRLISKVQRGVAAVCYRETPGLAIDDFISAELYDEIGAGEDDALNDLVFLVEVLLDVFRYSKKPSVINRRLKLFCLKNMMVAGQTAVGGRETHFSDLFRFFLFFHPCSEDYIDAFSWNGSQCVYKGGEIDLTQQVAGFFGDIIQRKSSFPSLAGFTGEQLGLSRDLTIALLNSILQVNDPVSFAALSPGTNDLLSDIFVMPAHFFELHRNKREQFFSLLEEHIDHYIVTSWEGDPGSQASVYYGPDRNDTVESYFSRPSRINRKRKYLAEFFIDLYVFYILRDPDGLQEGISYFSGNRQMQLKLAAVLFSHPFYNGEARLQMIRAGVDEILPQGFWTEKIQRMKNSVK
jgi:hypothetical protein